MVQFCLREGVTRWWVELVSPLDSVPASCESKWINHSRVTHNLTANFEHYSTDYSKIIKSLLKFLNGGVLEKSEELFPSSLPPLYVMPGLQTEASSCILRYMLNKAGLLQTTFSIYPLPQLLFDMCSDKIQCLSMAEGLLDKDPYSNHSGGLACWLHEALKKQRYCSLSISKRKVFCFFDSALHSFKHIRKVEGYHFADAKDVGEEEEYGDIDIKLSKIMLEDQLKKAVLNIRPTVTRR